jgi:hypothetical protein
VLISVLASLLASLVEQRTCHEKEQDIGTHLGNPPFRSRLMLIVLKTWLIRPRGSLKRNVPWRADV